MTQSWIRIAIWYSLHEAIQISGSSQESIFESPVHRVHNGHKSEYPVTEFESHERVRIAATRNHTHTQTCYTHVHINTLIHTHYIYVYEYTHTYIYSYIHTYIYTYAYTTHIYT